MSAINVLMKPASGLCNMSCDYCFYCDEMQKRSQKSYGLMTENTLRNIIRKTILSAEGAISYAYQGGEPTLRGIEFYKKAIELQKQYNRNGIQVQNALQTNGYAITEEWCRFFAEYHFLVGISIDGMNSEEPAGSYKFCGHVKEKNGHIIGSSLGDIYQFDPALRYADNKRTTENN